MNKEMRPISCHERKKINKPKKRTNNRKQVKRLLGKTVLMNKGENMASRKREGLELELGGGGNKRLTKLATAAETDFPRQEKSENIIFQNEGRGEVGTVATFKPKQMTCMVARVFSTASWRLSPVR
jgi:hypothetical protein